MIGTGRLDDLSKAQRERAVSYLLQKLKICPEPETCDRGHRENLSKGALQEVSDSGTSRFPDVIERLLAHNPARCKRKKRMM